MKVLSLFNGISCGRIALERAGIIVERYVSYEIDKYANQVAKSNYPHDEYCGDVFVADFTQYKGFDILIGGSPCTSWSKAKNNRETMASGVGWELFMQYKRALTESDCRYFLYENNYGIHKDIQAAISKELGVEPVMINSALVSAQQRKRLYWTNIPNIEQPQDKGVSLRDILEKRIFEPINYKAHKDSDIVITDNSIRCQRQDKKHSTIQGTHVHFEHSKTQTVSVSHVPKVLEPVRVGDMPNAKGEITGSQPKRIYSIDGKSVTLQAGGGGNSDKSAPKTGLYAERIYAGTIDPSRGKPIYPVRDGQIAINGRRYPIKLNDGLYIIRKLTVNECCRLQTLPDGYCDGVSATQAYKGLGNGWTVDVIAHILSHINSNTQFETISA